MKQKNQISVPGNYSTSILVSGSQDSTNTTSQLCLSTNGSLSAGSLIIVEECLSAAKGNLIFGTAKLAINGFIYLGNNPRICLDVIKNLNTNVYFAVQSNCRSDRASMKWVLNGNGDNTLRSSIVPSLCVSMFFPSTSLVTLSDCASGPSEGQIWKLKIN